MCWVVIGFAVRIFVDYRSLSFALGWGVVFLWNFTRRLWFGDINCWWWGLARESALLELVVGEC